MQLEMEMSSNTCEGVKDISKLICGRSDFKIAILPTYQNYNEYVNNIIRIGSFMIDPFYVVLLPYLHTWGLEQNGDIRIYKYDKIKNKYIQMM